MANTRKELNIIYRRLRSAYITSTISVTLVLFMLGLVGLLVLNAKKIATNVKENIGFSILIKDEMNQADIMKLQKTLDATQFVKSTEFISKEKAAEELKKDLGEDFIEYLGHNPLLSCIDVKLYASYANPDSIKVIEKKLQQYSEIKEIYYQRSLIEKVNENVKKISLTILIFSSLLMFVAFALINNTIRLSLYAKRFIINTMKLVGATHGFIRKPFLYKGVYMGVVSSVLAIILLTVTVYFVQKEVQEIIFLTDLSMILALFGIVIVLGVIINVISTFLALNKYINMRTDELYF